MFDSLKKMLGFKSKPATYFTKQQLNSEAAKHAVGLLSRSDFDDDLIIDYLQSELDITKNTAESFLFEVGFNQIEVLTQEGKKVSAIKLLRRLSSTGLKESKMLIDELESVLPTGCTSFVRTKVKMYRDKC